MSALTRKLSTRTLFIRGVLKPLFAELKMPEAKAWKDPDSLDIIVAYKDEALRIPREDIGDDNLFQKTKRDLEKMLEASNASR